MAVPPQKTTSAFLFQHDQRMTAALQAALEKPAIKPLLTALRATEINIVEQDSPLAPDLNGIAGPAAQLKHSPLSFLSQFDFGFHTSFPRDLWQIFFCTATGHPNPGCVTAQRIDRKCKCGKRLDLDGHHLQTCTQHQAGTWTKVHDNIQRVWCDNADLANINAISDPKTLPRPNDSDRHADIEFQTRTKTRRAIVGDVSLVHPFIGDADDRTTWGTYKPKAMQQRSDDKNAKYLRFHNALNYMFLPLVCTTLGAISDDALRLLFYLADGAATANFETIGERIYDDEGQYTHQFLHHRTSLFTRFKSRIALSACRGLAIRGTLGTGGSISYFLDENFDLRRARAPGRRGGGLRRRRRQAAGREYARYDPLWTDDRRRVGSSR